MDKVFMRSELCEINPCSQVWGDIMWQVKARVQSLEKFVLNELESAFREKLAAVVAARRPAKKAAFLEKKRLATPKQVKLACWGC